MAARRDSRSALQVAVAHEVGNLLAAIRLSAYLLPAAEARERARGARQIEQLAAQAGELLAQVRPLLADSRAGAAVAPAEVLEGVRRALADAPGNERLEVKAAPRGLPDVRVDPDALHHALLTLARGALEAASDGGRVVLRAGRSGRRIAFEIADTGRPFEPPPARALPRGRALAVRLADAALRPEGGAAELRAGRGGTRVRVLAAAAARARGARKRRARAAGRSR
jgi:signal transduction histidine kinase